MDEPRNSEIANLSKCSEVLQSAGADGIVAADSITQQVRALNGRFGVKLSVHQTKRVVPRGIDCLMHELEKRLSPPQSKRTNVQRMT